VRLELALHPVVGEGVITLVDSEKLLEFTKAANEFGLLS